jgi:hypothetical protein
VHRLAQRQRIRHSGLITATIQPGKQAEECFTGLQLGPCGLRRQVRRGKKQRQDCYQWGL